MRRNGNKTTRRKYRRPKQQRGGFLNRCDFAYTGRDTVNQVWKTVPGLNKNVY